MKYQVSFYVEAKSLGTVIGALIPTAEISSLTVAPVESNGYTRIKKQPTTKGTLYTAVKEFMEKQSKPVTLIEVSDYISTIGLHGKSASPCLSKLALAGLVKKGKMLGTWDRC